MFKFWSISIGIHSMRGCGDSVCVGYRSISRVPPFVLYFRHTTPCSSVHGRNCNLIVPGPDRHNHDSMYNRTPKNAINIIYPVQRSHEYIKQGGIQPLHVSLLNFVKYWSWLMWFSPKHWFLRARLKHTCSTFYFSSFALHWVLAIGIPVPVQYGFQLHKWRNTSIKPHKINEAIHCNLFLTNKTPSAASAASKNELIGWHTSLFAQRLNKLKRTDENEVIISLPGNERE